MKDPEFVAKVAQRVRPAVVFDAGGSLLGNNDRFPIQPGSTTTIAEMQGAGIVTHLWVTIDCKSLHFLRKLTLRAYWDGETEPSIETPIGAGANDAWPPTLHGTGTEDYFNCSWCPTQEYHAPYHGIITGGGPNWTEPITIYRFHLEDPVIFQKQIRVTIERGHANKRWDDLTSVAF